MRLKCIKLAGFKSFVDPTLANFPSNMAGVVGPNGCGKSNVIDAVRWVMGESSAKQLRGDSMTDVIFNGSGGRKPVNQASIELVFDNSSGRITGEYASYNEISVRRRVTRDGQSDYFLNSSKCRRRDIMDIFLGTGLGPRSYSIIEQGMISNLITAKPEDLRVYLEEAAGISKYKERRRETENRIKRTQENLERLTDLREELERQLQRLQRQSVAAEKYREFKAQERDLKTQLLALRWQALDTEVQNRQQQISDAELNVEKAVLAELESTTEIEKVRELLTGATDVFNKVQAAYYEAGAEIARIEQDIHHREERQRQLKDDIEQTALSYAEAEKHHKEDLERANAWQAEIDELARQKADAEAEASNSESALATAEEKMNQLQQQWEELQQTASATKRQADVQQSTIQHLEQSLKVLSERRERLSGQGTSEDGLAKLVEESKTLAIAQTGLQTKVDSQQGQEQAQADLVSGARTALNSLAAELDEIRNKLQNSRGRMASLTALQEAALEDRDAASESWLAENDMGQAPRLAESVDVEAGWEKAVETVLGQSLKAVCVDKIDALAKKIGTFKEGQLEIIEPLEGPVDNKYLSSKLKSGTAQALVASVLIAKDLSQALKLRGSLKPGESVVTQDGIWIGANWCRLNSGSVTESGVLERKSDIEVLAKEITSLEKQEQSKREQIEEQQSELARNEESQRAQRSESASLASALADMKANYSAIEAKKTQLESQLKHNLAEIDSATKQYSEQEAELAQSRQALAEALDLMEQQSNTIQNMQTQREEAKQQLSEARSQNHQFTQKVQQIEFRSQTVSTQLASVKESIERLRVQIERLDTRRANLAQTDVEPELDPLAGLRKDLNDRLESRLSVENEMTKARAMLQGNEHQLRQNEGARQKFQQELAEQRDYLSSCRLQAQEVLTRRETIIEQLGEAKPETVLSELSEEATEQSWQQQLEKIENRIQRLGPINLAAIDEYKTESERKEYLDAQNEEVEQALETLREAIRKIDKETRTRFKETFDKVNSGVKELFPKLFGGGHAYLELTSDDFLETGVTIMARPPGKRNSTIHLLSGGEKALTAISLVFAIFHLNPAPFCMLDEVDAPLDDANCGRFVAMVKEMSEKVQFIFITHNKITMELANQLMGVTMHEPGVSRLVSVDVEEAIELAAV